MATSAVGFSGCKPHIAFQKKGRQRPNRILRSRAYQPEPHELEPEPLDKSQSQSNKSQRQPSGTGSLEEPGREPRERTATVYFPTARDTHKERETPTLRGDRNSKQVKLKIEAHLEECLPSRTTLQQSAKTEERTADARQAGRPESNLHALRGVSEILQLRL